LISVNGSKHHFEKNSKPCFALQNLYQQVGAFNMMRIKSQKLYNMSLNLTGFLNIQARRSQQIKLFVIISP